MSQLTPPTYSYALSDTPGVVAANNFISFFNPANSGKVMLAFTGIVNSYATGVSSTDVSLVSRYITSATGGTQISAETGIYPLRFDFPDSKIEVRIGNPTVGLTALGSIGNFLPPITSGLGGTTSSSLSAPSGGAVPFIPGEGFVWRTEAGNVNQRWNLQFIWAEVDI